ncbi:glycosyltransferase family 4 protein [Thermopirellula anaerolimosa]
MTIFVLGYPGAMGGANTECWHTVKLWRQAGWEVHLIPTWGRDDRWRERLDMIGAVTHCVSAADLEKVPGLAGSVVVAMCNGNLWGVYGRLRKLDCRVVWVNCMTFMFPDERQATQADGPADAYVFQSHFQRSMLEPELAKLGYRPEQGHLIRGAFDVEEFPFNPRTHQIGTEFVIGRLARPDLDKWSSNTWPIYGAVPYAHRKALVMGWNERLEKKLGKPPAWATCLKPQEISTQEFLSRCHVLLAINGGARENWPRVGLEAMAAGVPLVVQNQWGWREMVRHGATGFLCDNDQELAYYTAHLAYDERKRLVMAEAARAHVERLADAETILAGWRRLFDFLGTARSKAA